MLLGFLKTKFVFWRISSNWGILKSLAVHIQIVYNRDIAGQFNCWVFVYLRQSHTEDLLIASSRGVDAGNGLPVDIPHMEKRAGTCCNVSLRTYEIYSKLIQWVILVKWIPILSESQPFTFVFIQTTLSKKTPGPGY